MYLLIIKNSISVVIEFQSESWLPAVGHKVDMHLLSQKGCWEREGVVSKRQSFAIVVASERYSVVGILNLDLSDSIFATVLVDEAEAFHFSWFT